MKLGSHVFLSADPQFPVFSSLSEMGALENLPPSVTSDEMTNP